MRNVWFTQCANLLFLFLFLVLVFFCINVLRLLRLAFRAVCGTVWSVCYQFASHRNGSQQSPKWIVYCVTNHHHIAGMFHWPPNDSCRNKTKRKENKIKSLRRELLIIPFLVRRLLFFVAFIIRVSSALRCWFPLESTRMASVQAVIHFKELVKTLKNTPKNQKKTTTTTTRKMCQLRVAPFYNHKIPTW